jgi:hypothetical protein
MVNVSCSTKLHSFQLAEQLAKKNILHSLLTVYHSRKNPIVAKFNRRIDQEEIKLGNIITFPLLTLVYKFGKDPYKNNSFFEMIISY